jgi:hypothetical protein
MSGLVQVKPTSVTTSGTATIGTNGTVTFSGATHFTFNGIFNATYRKYAFYCEYNTAIASELYCDLSLNGTPTGSATGYNYSYLDYRTTSFDSGSVANIPIIAKTGNLSQDQAFVMIVTGPFLAGPTVARSDFSCMYASANPIWCGNRVWHHTLTTSYNGLQIYGASNWSGRLQIYGFKE